MNIEPQSIDAVCSVSLVGVCFCSNQFVKRIMRDDSIILLCDNCEQIWVEIKLMKPTIQEEREKEDASN